MTFAFNVPLNDMLATVDPASAEGASQWAGYLTTWTNWNHVRAAAALLAAASFTVAFCLAGGGLENLLPHRVQTKCLERGYANCLAHPNTKRKLCGSASTLTGCVLGRKESSGKRGLRSHSRPQGLCHWNGASILLVK